MHIAAALDKPMIALFGSSSPGFTPPLSDKARDRQPEPAVQPLLQSGCPLGHFDCMTQAHSATGIRGSRCNAPACRPTRYKPGKCELTSAAGCHPRYALNRFGIVMATGIPKGFEFIESLAKRTFLQKPGFSDLAECHDAHPLCLNDPDSSADKSSPHHRGGTGAFRPTAAACQLGRDEPGGKPVVDLRTAISRLGYAMVRNLAISVGMRQLSRHPRRAHAAACGKSLEARILVASISYILAKKRTPINPDEAMLAGMLHDIGEFYILTRVKDLPGSVCR